MSYRTPQQLAEETAMAKACSLLLVAEHFGYSLVRHGNIYISKADKGLTVFHETNSFFHYYENRGGSPIDFVIRERGGSVGEAVRYINEEIGGISRQEMSYDSIKSAKDLLLPPKNENHKRVFAYLSKTRGIAPEVITDCLHRHLIYEDKEHHNVVFVGYDKDENPKHCFIRGTISGVVYRGDTYGSDKSYGFTVLSDYDYKDDSVLLVFEAPIDLLSYKSMHPEDRSHMLAMGMLSLEPVYRFLDEHSCRNVSLILDNDEAGNKAMEDFSEELLSKGYNVIAAPVVQELRERGVKDVNELLLAKKQPTISPQFQTGRAGR